MLSGRATELQRQNRFFARWVAPIVSSSAGHPIDPRVLLGEATPEELAAEEAERKIREGRQRERRVLRQLKKLKTISEKEK